MTEGPTAQVWVQVGAAGRMAERGEAWDVAQLLMIERRKAVGSLHEAWCAISHGRAAQQSTTCDCPVQVVERAVAAPP